MATPRHGLRHLSLLSILSLSLALSACGGGGGGDSRGAVAPPSSSAGPGTGAGTGTGGGTAPAPSVPPPSSPPPSDSGPALPPVAGSDPGAGSGTGTGGGSGGATPGIDSSFQVSVNKRELVFEGEQGTSQLPALIIASGSGNPPSIIYTGSVDLGTSLDRVLVETSGDKVNFYVYPKWNLPAGDYSGSLQLFACPDERCTRHFAGSPVTIPYKITVTKSFSVTGSISLTTLSGGSVGAPVVVQLPAGASSYTAVPEADWVRVTNVTPERFDVFAQPMPPGRYFTRVRVTAGDRTRDVAVDYTVTGDASTVTQIIPSAPRIDLNAYILGSASSTLSVTLPSWSRSISAALVYPDGPSGWLELRNTGERLYSLSASAATLAPGRYEAAVLLTSGYLTTPVTVPVSFTVGAPTWRIGGNTHFAVSPTTTTAGLGSSLTVELPQVPAQQWTATTTSPWLSVTTASGTAGGAPLRVAVDPVQLLALENFASHRAEVVLTAGDRRIAPTTLQFTLDKALSETHFVSPATRLPGETGTYILRGRGFDRIADLGAGLVVDGATPLQVTRVNDTQLNVRLAGAAGGAVGFSTPNALGAATGAPSLQVVPQGAFPYGTVATAGNKGGLVFDARRQALYSANKTMHTVMRFAYKGSGWEVLSVPVPSVDAVALSPDGKSLVATSTTNGIVLIDPATFAVQGTYGPAEVGGDTLNGLPRLAVTNDGRAYFQGGTWGGLNYFDLRTRQFGQVPREQGYSFHDGPWFSVSGDGSRLDIVQSAGISPSPPMLYMDTSDNVPKVNPAGIAFWYETAQSLRGERFVDGTYRVYDRDFAVLGDLVLPGSGYFGRTPLVSPDGNRVYVMAYSTNGLYGLPETPRVYVFDSSRRMVTSTQLPLLGYFSLPDYPTCRISDYYCDTRALGTISPDGKTLFFIGDARLVVAPVPATLEQVHGTPLQRAPVGVGVAPKVQGVRLRR